MNPFEKVEEKPAPGVIVGPDGSEWMVWRKGDGTTTGYVEVMPHPSGRYVTVPGSTRTIQGPKFDLTKATR